MLKPGRYVAENNDGAYLDRYRIVMDVKETISKQCSVARNAKQSERTSQAVMSCGYGVITVLRFIRFKLAYHSISDWRKFKYV